MSHLNIMSIVDQQAKEYISGIGYDYPINKEDLLLSYCDGNINIEALENPDNNINYRLSLIIPYIYNYISSYHPKNFKIILSLGDIIQDQYKIPSIAFTKKKHIKCFLIPNIDFFTGVIYNSLKEVIANDIPFNNKFNKAIFVGSSTGSFDDNIRIKFCQITKHYDNIESCIHNLCQAEKSRWVERYADIDSYLCSGFSITDQIKRKIVINIDGNTVCWSRLYWQMQSNSIPVYIKNTESDIQFFDYIDSSNGYISCSLIDAVETITNILSYPMSRINEINQYGQSYIKLCFDDYIANSNIFLQKIFDHILTLIINK